MTGKDTRFRVWHKPTLEMYWLDVRWGNHYSAGAGWIMAVPWGEEKSRGISHDNRVQLSPDDCDFLIYYDPKLLNEESNEGGVK